MRIPWIGLLSATALTASSLLSLAKADAGALSSVQTGLGNPSCGELAGHGCSGNTHNDVAGMWAIYSATGPRSSR